MTPGEEFYDHIQANMFRDWRRFAENYGSFTASWIDGPASAQECLRLMVENPLRSYVKGEKYHWDIELDEDDAPVQGTPTALILSNGLDHKVFDVKFSRKLIRFRDADTGKETLAILKKGGFEVARVISEMVVDFFFPLEGPVESMSF